MSRDKASVSDFGAYGSAVWLDNDLGYAVVMLMEADQSAGQAVSLEVLPVLTKLFGGEYTPLEPSGTQVPELTTAQCLDWPPVGTETCGACICDNCLSEVATCHLFEEGALCEDVLACQADHYDECGQNAKGQTNCYYDLDGTLGTGPCADQINAAAANARGASSTAVIGGACQQEATDNACAAVVAYGACVQAHCADACPSPSDMAQDMDGGSP